MKKGVCVCDKKRERNQKYIEKNQEKEILDEEFKLIRANSNSIICPLCAPVVALTVIVVVALLVYTSKCVSFRFVSFIISISMCIHILNECVFVCIYSSYVVFFPISILMYVCSRVCDRNHTEMLACAQTNKRMNEQTNKPSNAITLNSSYENRKSQRSEISTLNR